MKIDDLRALAKQRRRIRGYDEDCLVPDELVRAILDCTVGHRPAAMANPGNSFLRLSRPARFVPVGKAEWHFLTGLATATLLY